VNPHHPKPWHRGSVFGDGHRRPLDREQRARFRYLLHAWHHGGNLTRAARDVGEALVRRLGTDGRLDPNTRHPGGRHRLLRQDSAQGAAVAARLRLGALVLPPAARRVGRAADQLRIRATDQRKTGGFPGAVLRRTFCPANPEGRYFPTAATAIAG
jgi:hypothetical protein